MISPNGMYYEDSGGQDAALLFLHYFGGSGAVWQPLTAMLSRQMRCIAPDLRGFGKSQPAGNAFCVADYADDVAGLIRALGLKKYVLAGHSMGGKIALALAARRPAGLQSLLLLAPSPPTPEPISDQERDALRGMFGSLEKIGAHLRKLCAQPLPDAAFRAEASQNLRASAAAWNAWIDSGSREDISAGMAAIRVPALVVGGDADKGITQELLRSEVVARLPHARLELLPDTGHLLPLEQPAQIASIFRDWQVQTDAR